MTRLAESKRIIQLHANRKWTGNCMFQGAHSGGPVAAKLEAKLQTHFIAVGFSGQQ